MIVRLGPPRSLPKALRQRAPVSAADAPTALGRRSTSVTIRRHVTDEPRRLVAATTQSPWSLCRVSQRLPAPWTALRSHRQRRRDTGAHSVRIDTTSTRARSLAVRARHWNRRTPPRHGDERRPRIVRDATSVAGFHRSAVARRPYGYPNEAPHSCRHASTDYGFVLRRQFCTTAFSRIELALLRFRARQGRGQGRGLQSGRAAP